jgi:hypothetical protein
MKVGYTTGQQTIVVRGTNCIGSCKSNQHEITTMTVRYETYGDILCTYRIKTMLHSELFIA